MRRWVTVGTVFLVGLSSTGLLERGTAKAAPSKAEGFASCIDALRERLIPIPEVADDDPILEPGDLPREKLGAFGTPPEVRTEVIDELNAKAKGIPWIRWGSGPRPKEIRVRVDATDMPHAWTPRGLELTEMHPAFVHVLTLGGDNVAVIGLSENPMTSRTAIEMKTKGR